ncbi:MAG: N-acetyltransferase [Eubacteriales bacterium]|nr:N-acetyltransferase [Eubacteriales bacterium]
MAEFVIRKATMMDIDTIMAVFECARAFMASRGNGEQWVGYPPPALAERDIRSGGSYVVESGGAIEGVFYIAMGPEDLYETIFNGAWHHDGPYAALHRLASRGRVKGIAAAIFAWCSERFDYIRVDTGEKNVPMQRAFLKAGFRYCGRVRPDDGGEYWAYDWVKPDNDAKD